MIPERKLLVVDTKGPSGHVWLNQRLIDQFAEGAEELTVAATQGYLDDLALTRTRSIALSSRKPERVGSIAFRFLQVLLTLRTLRLFRRGGYEAIVFLSYDTIVLYVLGLFLPKHVYVVEHNNIDQALESRIKCLCFERLPSRICHICFENYIGDYVEQTTGRRFIGWPHPIRIIDRSKMGLPAISEPYVFVPSRGSSVQDLNVFSGLLEETELPVVCRHDPMLVDRRNIRALASFQDYDELFIRSCAIFLPVRFTYRVSGPFYEAIGNEKPVILTTSMFARAVADRAEPRLIFLWDVRSEPSAMALQVWLREHCAYGA